MVGSFEGRFVKKWPLIYDEVPKLEHVGVQIASTYAHVHMSSWLVTMQRDSQSVLVW